MPRTRTMFLVAIIVFFAASSAGAQTPESQFERLHKLRVKVMTERATAQDKAVFRQIRDFFVNQGDEGAKFLIAKLRLINENEGKFLKAPDDCDGGLTYHLDTLSKKTIDLAKMDVVMMLADVYGKAMVERPNIIAAIGDSYTPSSCGGDDLQKLNFALIRIGPEAVPKLLEIAEKHPNGLARCGVARGLKSLAEQIRKTSPDVKSDPPEIKCDAQEAGSRPGAVAAWKDWWTSHLAQIHYPTPPSVFEEAKPAAE